jgi:Holliday junction resolvase RusA-like endonuclease
MEVAAVANLEIDRPFAPPLECVMDLPFPPSTNKIWAPRKGGGGQLMRSGKYSSWLKKADKVVVVNGSWRHRVRMPGRFTALILLDQQKRARSDCDNRIKGVLDWAQKVDLIKNDQLCDEVTARWVPTHQAPAGCRLVLRSIA